MGADFVLIDSPEKLDELFADSNGRAVVFFKHSSTCSISSDVYREVNQVDAVINLVVVQTARDISDLIAVKTGVRHQSPQAMVVRNGHVVYHAAHYGITAADIRKNLE